MKYVTVVYRGELDELGLDELTRRLEHVAASLELELEIHYENMLADALVDAGEPTRSGGPGVLLVGTPRPEGSGVRAIALAGLEAHSPGADTPAPCSRRAELDEPHVVPFSDDVEPEPERADWRDVGLHRIEPPPRFAILDAHARSPLAIVDAETPLGALDAYCELECMALYSENPELDELVYVLEGMLGGVFSNYEVLAYPLAYPLEAVGPGPNGYAVVDADEHYVADGLSSAAVEGILGGGSWHAGGAS
jgi:hypothetical protein